MKKRKGVVLFVTLMMILLLMGIVNIFLSKTKESKDKVTTIFAMNQTNAVMHNLLGYLNDIQLDEYAIYFASQTIIPLSFGQTNIALKIESDQKLININSLIQASLNENSGVSDKFLILLSRYRLQNPTLFLHLLQDTIDKDIESRNGTESEIVIEYPTFRNLQVYNKTHLNIIVDYYFKETGDIEIYNIPFDDLFSYSSGSMDLNFVSIELMKMIFDDANQYTLNIIDKYEGVFEEIEDMPFDEYYRKKIGKGMLGQGFTTKTNILNIKINLNYKNQFESKIHFKYNIKSKNIFDYEIDEISIF
ncbi:hypothetical protein [Sulfurimonas sp.]